MKRLFAIALAIVMIMALAVPAMAAEEPTYSITIDHADAYDNHIYEAYQIFSGKIDTTGSTLTEVKWGTGINAGELLAELAGDDAWDSKVSSTTTAKEMADLLSAKETTTAMFETFRAAAGRNLTGVVAATAATADAVDGKYVLDLSEAGAGYYLVKDKDGSLDFDPTEENYTHDTYTSYILRVVGQDTLHPKDGAVTGDKVIIDGGSAKEAADYSIGDTVKFRITGRLPANYSSFSSYFYEFQDEMCAGLTYTTGSVKIYLENHGVKTELENPTEDDATPYFTVTSTDPQHVYVTFQDLKTVAASANRTIDASTLIIMEYEAVLNTAAEIGEPGNRNDARIKFSNNPNKEGYGITPKDSAWAFTWELDVNKTNDKGEKLGNAKFVFYRESLGSKQYVILDDANKVSGWTTDKDKATVIVSKENEVMPIIGLEADTYYLEETEAPDGYNMLEEPITVVITALADGPDGEGGYKVSVLTVKFGNGEVNDGNKADGIVSGTVVNKSGAVLPETGGIGTTLFYILGGFMVVGAAVLLVTKKRMAV